MHVQLEKGLGSAAGHAYCVHAYCVQKQDLCKTVSNVYGMELIRVN